MGFIPEKTIAIYIIYTYIYIHIFVYFMGYISHSNLEIMLRPHMNIDVKLSRHK